LEDDCAAYPAGTELEWSECEARAEGELPGGLLTGLPSKLIPDVIKNTAVKIVHRLPAADERQAVGATMNLTEDQSAYLVTLTPGEAAVFTDGMDYPLLTRMPDGTGREITNAAPSASPAPLITSRSPTCGPACLSSPCTLRQVRSPACRCRRPADHPVGRTVRAGPSDRLAHAHARPGLRRRPGRDGLPAAGLRAGPCVDAAVAARVPVIAARISGPALAVHVLAAMHAALDEDRWLCDQHEPQWLAPPYRWAVVLDSLQASHRRDPEAGPHPRTAEWETAYSRALPGQTCAAQLEHVRRWYDTDQRDQRRVRAVGYGTRPASSIEHAVGADATDQDWEQRLTDALAAFHDCRWPLDLLRPGIAT
jgi:uncharacterized protein